jgi:hypothetical protein
MKVFQPGSGLSPQERLELLYPQLPDIYNPRPQASPGSPANWRKGLFSIAQIVVGAGAEMRVILGAVGRRAGCL